MGLLDEAIRDHLDLKRRNGADPAEIERMEREALGPVRRGGADEERPQFADEAPSANDTGDGVDMETRPLTPSDGFDAPASSGSVPAEDFGEPFDDEPLGSGDAPEFDEPKSHKRRRFGLFGRHRDEDDEEQSGNDDFEYVSGEYILDDEFPDGPPPSLADSGAPAAPSTPSAYREPEPEWHDEPAAHESASAHEPAAPAEPSYEPEPSYEQRSDAPSFSYDKDEDFGRDSSLPERPHFGTARQQTTPEPEPEPGDFSESPAAREPAPAPSQHDPEATAMYNVLDDEPDEIEDDYEPPAPRSSRPVRDDLEREPAPSWADSPDDEPFFDDEPEPKSSREPIAEDGDVLEGTPDFFQDAPDHDRLWFEQKPPKDFDFEG